MSWVQKDEEKSEREEVKAGEVGALTPTLSHQNGRGRKRIHGLPKTPGGPLVDSYPPAGFGDSEDMQVAKPTSMAPREASMAPREEGIE